MIVTYCAQVVEVILIFFLRRINYDVFKRHFTGPLLSRNRHVRIFFFGFCKLQFLLFPGRLFFFRALLLPSSLSFHFLLRLFFLGRFLLLLRRFFERFQRRSLRLSRRNSGRLLDLFQRVRRRRPRRVVVAVVRQE